MQNASHRSSKRFPTNHTEIDAIATELGGLLGASQKHWFFHMRAEKLSNLNLRSCITFQTTRISLHIRVAISHIKNIDHVALKDRLHSLRQLGSGRPVVQRRPERTQTSGSDRRVDYRQCSEEQFWKN